MTKSEKIAREFMVYLDLVVSGSDYYTTFPDASYAKRDLQMENSALESFVNVDAIKSFGEDDTFKENIIVTVTVGCRKGDNTASYLDEMIDDALRAIYLNHHAIQIKFHLSNNIMPVGNIIREIERADVMRGVADINFSVPVIQNASWLMDAKEV